MYGLLHNALVGMMESRLGPGEWDAIQIDAGMEPGTFLAMDVYDDAMLFDLAEATARRTSSDRDEVLHSLGRYWITFTKSHGWATLYDRTGTTLLGFLTQLDGLHLRVAATMPAGHMPTFRVVDATATTIDLDYFSTRTGLAPMVSGMLSGLVDHFEEPCRVRLVSSDEAANPRRHRFHLERMTIRRPTRLIAPHNGVGS